MARIFAVSIVLAGFFVTGDIPTIIRGGTAAVTETTGLVTSFGGWCGQFATVRWDASDLPSKNETGRSSASPEAPRMNQAEIPADAVRSITLNQLTAGDRLLVWCGNQGGQCRYELLAIDIIDQTSGEVLLSRHLAANTDSTQPQRVQLQNHTVQGGQMVSIQPVQSSPAFRRGQELSSELSSGRPSRGQQIGPVIAIKVMQR